MVDPKVVIRPILSETKGWFEKAIPNPNIKNFTTQLGVHCEEVAEMLEEISAQDSEASRLLSNAFFAMKQLSMHLKKNGGVSVEEENRVPFLDSICDQLVTATGVAHMSSFDPLGALNEVNRSNFSKFDENGNPIFDENMKVTKGRNYTKPDLTPFV